MKEEGAALTSQYIDLRIAQILDFIKNSSQMKSSHIQIGYKRPMVGTDVRTDPAMRRATFLTAWNMVDANTKGYAAYLAIKSMSETLGRPFDSSPAI